MNATQITEYLDTELPNAKVFADLRDALAEVVEDDHFMVGVDDEDVAIPADTEMHIVYKAFYNTVVGLS